MVLILEKHGDEPITPGVGYLVYLDGQYTNSRTGPLKTRYYRPGIACDNEIRNLMDTEFVNRIESLKIRGLKAVAVPCMSEGVEIHFLHQRDIFPLQDDFECRTDIIQIPGDSPPSAQDIDNFRVALSIVRQSDALDTVKAELCVSKNEGASTSAMPLQNYLTAQMKKDENLARALQVDLDKESAELLVTTNSGEGARHSPLRVYESSDGDPMPPARPRLSQRPLKRKASPLTPPSKRNSWQGWGPGYRLGDAPPRGKRGRWQRPVPEIATPEPLPDESSQDGQQEQCDEETAAGRAAVNLLTDGVMLENAESRSDAEAVDSASDTELAAERSPSVSTPPTSLHSFSSSLNRQNIDPIIEQIAMSAPFLHLENDSVVFMDVRACRHPFSLSRSSLETYCATLASNMRIRAGRNIICESEFLDIQPDIFAVFKQWLEWRVKDTQAEPDFLVLDGETKSERQKVAILSGLLNLSYQLEVPKLMDDVLERLSQIFSTRVWNLDLIAENSTAPPFSLQVAFLKLVHNVWQNVVNIQTQDSATALTLTPGSLQAAGIQTKIKKWLAEKMAESMQMLTTQEGTGATFWKVMSSCDGMEKEVFRVKSETG
ncbi:MAG: hypothetical protein Q9227_006931 [Pyrenula ochraceoflavens]